MKVYIGADHRGFALKEQLKSWLTSEGYDVIDCGNSSYDKDDDYPDFTFAVTDKVAAEPESRGIVFCGSGGGVIIAANKVRGIRAVLGVTTEDVVHNRDHNDANILSIAADFTDIEKSKDLVRAFLATPYKGDVRMQRRLKKIEERESR
ncbi:RpiB/LacA/LacB family sugar-phosphate isomerase [Candidatus Gottesmanbacteria bacterium]|nr:RpiB/LacA/LacB family sugar-phosphate isomerase [Candidatus Gottesmanbacteria bacterium]